MAGIVLLAGEGPSSWIVARALQRRFGDVTVVVEGAMPRGVFLRRRVRRLGLLRTAGQLLFYAYGRLLAARRAAPRRREILARHRLDATRCTAAATSRARPVPAGARARTLEVAPRRGTVASWHRSIIPDPVEGFRGGLGGPRCGA